MLDKNYSCELEKKNDKFTIISFLIGKETNRCPYVGLEIRKTFVIVVREHQYLMGSPLMKDSSWTASLVSMS